MTERRPRHELDYERGPLPTSRAPVSPYANAGFIVGLLSVICPADFSHERLSSWSLGGIFEAAICLAALYFSFRALHQIKKKPSLLSGKYLAIIGACIRGAKLLFLICLAIMSN